MPARIGLASPHVPEELVHAAGAVPVLLWPRAEAATPAADEYMEPFFDRGIRLLFEQALNGGLSDLDLLVIPRTSEASTKLYLYLREVQRQRPELPVPPLYLFDLLQTRADTTVRYDVQRARALYARLCGVTGAAPSDDALRLAVAEANRLRAGMQRISDERIAVPSRLAGSEALRRYAGAASSPHAMAPYSGPRLLLLGAPVWNPGFYELLEAAGAQVVAEDHAWGRRQYDCLTAVTDDPLHGIVERVQMALPSARTFPPSVSEIWIRAAAANWSPDGVVFVVADTDDSYGWDFPSRRALCAALELPVLLLPAIEPALPDRDAARVTGLVRDFVRQFTEAA